MVEKFFFSGAPGFLAMMALGGRRRATRPASSPKSMFFSRLSARLLGAKMDVETRMELILRPPTEEVYQLMDKGVSWWF